MPSARKKVIKGGVSWEGRVNVAGHPSLSKSFDSKVEALTWAAEKEALIRSGGKVSFKAEKVLVCEALAEYLKAHMTTVEDSDQVVSTLSKTKQYAVGTLLHMFGKEVAVGKLTAKGLSRIFEGLQHTQIPPPANKKATHKLYNGDVKRTYSPGSARKLYYAFKTAVEWHALEHGYSGQIEDIFKKVKVPPAWAAPRDRRFQGDEESRVMQACNGMYKDPRGWQLLIGLALETAMRAGELLGMRWDEVNTASSHRFILIPKDREKTRRGRQVPLSTKAIQIIDELRSRRTGEDERVFSSFPDSSVILGRGFKRITTRAGCPDLRFHDLRHEATSRFFETTNLQMMEIAAITGHTQIDTLQRYANLRPRILAGKLDARIDWTKSQQVSEAPSGGEEVESLGFDSPQVRAALETLKKAGLLGEDGGNGLHIVLQHPAQQGSQ